MPILPDVQMGYGVKIPNPSLVNLYGCRIGDNTKIGAFVEIQKGVSVGSRCKISSHTFICEGVVIEDEVFIGHGVMFINDRYPRATTNGCLQTEQDWQTIPTCVRHGASVGSGAVILCGVTVGENALVGAGAVVTHDVPDHTIVTGIPARVSRSLNETESGIPVAIHGMKHSMWREMPHRGGVALTNGTAGGGLPTIFAWFHRLLKVRGH